MCQHPSISTFYTSFIAQKYVWLVMPIYEGGSVTDILQYKFKGGITDESILAYILKHILQALQYLHKQEQIHRDVKSSNVLLDLKGNVFLGDFGVCAILKEKPVAKTFVGTLCWMAPEVLVADGYNTKADIWSLGITAMELAEGRAPYSDLTSMKIIKTIINSDPPKLQHEEKWDKQFKDFVYDCLQKSPGARPTATELLEKYAKFFSKACTSEAVVTSLIKGVPTLEERVF